MACAKMYSMSLRIISVCLYNYWMSINHSLELIGWIRRYTCESFKTYSLGIGSSQAAETFILLTYGADFAWNTSASRHFKLLFC